MFSFQRNVIPYLYSISWQYKNVIPKIMVTNKCLSNVSVSLDLLVRNKIWCANVIVTPEDNKRIVFTRGKPQTSKDWILFGGQIPPIAMDGDKLTWKKSSKKSKKKTWLQKQ